MSLLTSKEVAKAIRLENYGFIGTFCGWLLIKFLHISTINKIYNRNKQRTELDFLNGILKDFKIKFEIPKEDLERIPKKNGFITVSNHPLGGIDGILLLKIVLEQRSDYKIIGNFILHKVKPLAPYIFAVNPFENHKSAKSSIGGFRSALAHMKDGNPLGMFPAGEVSTQRDGKLLVDKPWEVTACLLYTSPSPRD